MRLTVALLLGALIFPACVEPSRAMAQNKLDIAALTNEALSQSKDRWSLRVQTAQAQLDKQNNEARLAVGARIKIQNGCSINSNNSLVLQVDAGLKKVSPGHSPIAIDRAVNRVADAWTPLMNAQLGLEQSIKASRSAKQHSDEFLWRAARDQLLRGAWVALVSNSASYDRFTALERTLLSAQLGSEVCMNDVDNAAALRSVFAMSSLPPLPFAAVFLVAQHSDHDPALQMLALNRLGPLARNGPDRIRLALLSDRVSLAIGRSQRFGTQLECKSGELVPVGIEPSRELDARRAGVGLPSLAEYVRSFPPNSCPR